jgi:hypothetical protein
MNALKGNAVKGRELPPIAEISVASMVLVIIGGIYMATYIPRRPPLAVPILLVALSGALVAADVVLLRRLRGFAWTTFVTVAKWALVAYVVSAGLIEFAFVKDHTRGAPLVVVTLMLLLFAVDVPLVIGFTAARFDNPTSP